MSEENQKSNESAAETGADATAKKSELEIAQDDVQKWKNEYLYLRAEFENYKKMPSKSTF